MITSKLSGRLGNITLEIFNFFWYAQTKNIPFNELILNLNYNATCCSYGKFKQYKFFDLKNYIQKNIEFFKNIQKNFIPSQIYESITAQYQQVDFNEAFAKSEPCSNVILVNNPANTSFIRSDKENTLKLFKQLFYNEDLINKNKTRIKDISERIALHIRRTDYAVWRNGACVLNPMQIKTAIESYVKKGNSKFAVFSDDIEWCKENVKHENVDIIFIEPDQFDYNDLILMSLCKDIFGNGGHSSFSGCAMILNKCSKINN